MKTINVMKASLLAGGMLMMSALNAQELFVFSEPASNMPARSISGKITGKFVKNRRIEQRYNPEIMLGLNKKWMVHGAVSFSDMYTEKLRFESGKIYAKYRFYSDDQVHRHFRMAAFGEVARSRNIMTYDELSLDGDQSGVQGGMIVTQLWNKLAVSATTGYLYVTNARPKINRNAFVYQGYHYSLSAGHLVLPVEYKSFNQTNVNIYAELLGQRATDKNRYFIDFAPAVQLIFHSNAKLNIGYRFQLAGNMYRMANSGFLVSFERTFLNAF
ncbi:MAG: hypothetical protein H0X41_07505 [Chitinophagaceae bacterium]|nr:hypothetical protein [Chitinophagaceae bacterium]